MTTTQMTLHIQDEQPRTMKKTDSRPRFASTATRVIKANNRTGIVSTLTILIGMLMMIGMAVSIIYTRPIGTKINNESGGQQTLLVDSEGHVVETGRAMWNTSLVDLPAMANFDHFNRLRSVTVKDVEAFDMLHASQTNALLAGATPNSLELFSIPMRSVKIIGWTWISASWMSLSGADGTSILIADGNVEVRSPPDGYLSYAPGSGEVFSTHPEVNLTEAEVLCEANGCPRGGQGKCAARTSETLVTEILCDGSRVWQWPPKSAAAGGNYRQLQGSAGECLQSDRYKRCIKRCEKMPEGTYRDVCETGCTHFCLAGETTAGDQ